MVEGNKYFLFLSELLGVKVKRQSSNKTIGRISEVCVTFKDIYPVISRLVISRGWFRTKVAIAWDDVLPFELPVTRLFVKEEALTPPFQPAEHEIMLVEEFLDSQIVDVSGCKVVRVNDLHLLKENNKVWVVHMDIGFRGILRRLGYLENTEKIAAWLFSYKFHDTFVSWKHVQRLEGSSEHHGFLGLQLKATCQNLTDLHPADLAEIIMDLKRNERIAFFRALDQKAAAEALTEIKPEDQRFLLDNLDKEKRLQVVGEMPPDKAADVLGRLLPKRRDEILKALPPQRSAEIQSLLIHPSATAGALMTTKFLALSKDLTVEQAMAKIKEQAAQTSALYYTYVVDENQTLLGVVPLKTMLTAAPLAKLGEIMHAKLVKIKETAPERKVTELFIKYTFGAVPVVDNQNKIKGIILFKDAVDKVLSAVAERGV